MNTMSVPSPLAPLAQAGLSVNEYAHDRLRIEAMPNVTLVRAHSLVDLPRTSSELSDWPDRVGRCRAAEPAVLCLGPHEWLLADSTGDAEAMLEYASNAVGPSSTAVYDVSDAHAVFRLTGAAAPWLLAKVCSLDLHADRADDSWCARTRMGQIAIVVYCRSFTDRAFDLIVDRSLAHHLWELLIDCAPHASELARASRGVA